MLNRQTESYFLHFALGCLINMTAHLIGVTTASIVLVRDVLTVVKTVLDSRSY